MQKVTWVNVILGAGFDLAFESSLDIYASKDSIQLNPMIMIKDPKGGIYFSFISPELFSSVDVSFFELRTIMQ